MHRLRLHRRLEPAVQLVVERPGAVHGRDVLRDPREVDRKLARVPERRGQLRRQVSRAVEPEHRHDAAGDDRLDDLRLGVALDAVSARDEAGLVAEDRGL